MGENNLKYMLQGGSLGSKKCKHFVMKESIRGRKTWTESDVLALLKSWKENDKELRSIKRNSHVYKKIANDLRQQGIDANVNEVHFKINNLKQRYRKEEIIGNPTLWKYFDKVKEILEDYTGPTSPQEDENTTTTVPEMPTCHVEKKVQIPLSIAFKLASTQHCTTTTSVSTPSTISAKSITCCGETPTLNSASSSSRKKKLSFKRELLNEIRRANDIAEKDRITNERLLRTTQTANEIHTEWLSLMREFINRGLMILDKKLDLIRKD